MTTITRKQTVPKHRKKLQVWLIIALFIIFITSIRVSWLDLFTQPHQPKAMQGVLDLREWNFDANGAVTLNGEWMFYPQVLLKNDGALSHHDNTVNKPIKVPGNWAPALHPQQDSTYGYGTYHLQILLGEHGGEQYALRLASILASSEVFVNGISVGKSGQPSSAAERYTARSVPYMVDFQADQAKVDIVIHVANYDNSATGGITQPIYFGPLDAIQRATWFSIGTELTVCIVLLFHAVYAFLIYRFGKRQSGLIYITLLMLFASAAVLFDDNMLLTQWLGIGYAWSTKLQLLSYLGVAIPQLQLTRHLLAKDANSKLILTFTMLCLVMCIFIVVAPIQLTLQIMPVYMIIVVIPPVIMLFTTLKAALQGEEDTILLALGSTSIAVNIIWGTCKSMGLLYTSYYPFDILISFFAFASFWFRRYFRTSIQLERMTEDLQQEHRLKDDFLANTSHELRNPLHGMMNLAQHVLESEHNSMQDSSKKNLELLVTVGRRMSSLLHDLFDLTRLKEKRVQLKLKKVSIQPVVVGVMDMMRHMTEGKPIRLSNEIPDTFPHVIADENRLTQILCNLVHNAIKFTNEGVVTVRADMSGGKAYIHVVDTGVGIDAHTEQSLFLPYKQGVAPDESYEVGLGLGLSISKQLTELHGGTLTFRSTPGKGSMFTFSLELCEVDALPLAEQQSGPLAAAVSVEESALMSTHRTQPTKASLLTDVAREGAVSKEERSCDSWDSRDSENSENLQELQKLQHSRSSRDLKHSLNSSQKDNHEYNQITILAVDDDPINLEILSQIFDTERYRIFTATNGKEALSLIQLAEFDLVIADVMMPHMSGYELARHIRERFSISELPILLLTARSSSNDIEAGFRAGANDYIIKPMDTLELKARVSALTQFKRSVHERLMMEAAWLQAQIQPHFLFNTLNSISALSEIDTDRMRRMLEEFSNYLRASFDFQNTKRLVLLEHELALVKSYLYIEKERFEDRMQIIWEVEQTALLHIPPLSIQPLVENAVRHGVLKRFEGGVITIRIKEHPDYTEVAIVDNGVGIHEQKLEQLLQVNPNRKTGIGLLNVDRRLKRIYGSGLHIESTLGKGTIVRFQMPRS
ncbi:ATP-binding protein [Paenibacillus sp. 481]|uniref:ATP-binding protein n=1 Tax=Paenibacillus sp. 481 TaxID=2835869 RepID=UPI001E323333|nr:ATP-binding protein [Paenibacillus sp. 481]UHA73543.1 response regulator [Paenibacillus sp. 481]